MNVSGACIMNKISGMVYVREDITPLMLEWKAIDNPADFKIELKTIKNLQATKDGSPKMIIKVIYEVEGEEKDVRLSFTNRPTMNNIKESLQTIVSRQRTTVENNSQQATPAPETVPISLSDENLLKNHELQQKLLNEDKDLRTIFTQSVIHFKLSPSVFWSSRLNILRTYALTISQHRGMYNVLSTIKPVATSDNKVHVNVTRSIINEIFETYPVVKKAFEDLVPAKFQEGEFWSRFFNSKLFRRLRGDKINNGERGDSVLDQYLTIMGDHHDRTNVEKIIDLDGNAQDNSTKLGNKPDFTMKFTEDDIDTKQNEMMILLKNMNNLSSKMISNSKDSNDLNEVKEVKELEIEDLNELQPENYIDLKINFKHDIKSVESVDHQTLNHYLTMNLVPLLDNGINLIDTYDRKDSINETANKIITMIKLNFKHFKTINHATTKNNDHISNDLLQKFIKLNITTVEFLSHFWQLFLNGNNPNQLKKIFNILKTCKTDLSSLKAETLKTINDNHDKISADLNYYLDPISGSLDKALYEYVKAVKSERGDEINDNGKRPLEV